jgi:hypothetical protein
MPLRDEPELLAMLIRNPIAWKMIACWKKVGMRGARKERVVERWAQLALVTEAEVEVQWRMLFDCGFCGRDGTVDDVALRFVRNEIQKQIPRTQRLKPPPETAPGPTPGEPTA